PGLFLAVRYTNGTQVPCRWLLSCGLPITLWSAQTAPSVLACLAVPPSALPSGFLTKLPFIGLFIDLGLTYNSHRLSRAGQNSVRELAAREVGFDQSSGCRRS